MSILNGCLCLLCRLICATKTVTFDLASDPCCSIPQSRFNAQLPNVTACHRLLPLSKTLSAHLVRLVTGGTLGLCTRKAGPTMSPGAMLLNSW